MKTTVNGIEITPQIAEVLASWYEADSPDSETRPEIYACWLSDVQDCLTRILMDTCKMDNEQVKHCLTAVIYLKDELRRFIPASQNKLEN